MNITKEYIDLCKNDKVQGLRPENSYGNWYDTDNGELGGVISCCADKNIYKNWVWLPTGEQLDEEIVKICENREDLRGNNIYYYVFNYDKDCKEYQAYIADGADSDNFLVDDENPLICKLKLLISLLKEE